MLPVCFVIVYSGLLFLRGKDVAFHAYRVTLFRTELLETVGSLPMCHPKVNLGFVLWGRTNIYHL